jgi:signal transduction histidine kinase
MSHQPPQVVPQEASPASPRIPRAPVSADDFTRLSLLQQLLVGVACALVAMGIRWLLDPWLGNRQPFTPAIAAVAVAAWFATWRAGLACALLAHLIANYFFVPPRGTFTFTPDEIVGATVFYLIAGVILYLSHRARCANLALETANDQLVDADRHRSEFLATLAHELRSPLGAIRTSASVLKSERASPLDAERALAALDRQVAHVDRLMDDLMDAARIEQGKITLNRTRVPVRELVETALDAAQPHLAARGQQAEVDVPPDAGEIVVDRSRLVQVISNLLHNAAKFSPAGATVSIRVRRDALGVMLRVVDRGAGIPPDRVEWIFGTFSQLQPGSEGLGLGLALVRKLVEMHGGTVRARSAGAGQGATFEVWLPAQP